LNQAAPIEPGLRAAQYVRASTEHQQYSTENQADKMLEYAEQRGMEIVCTYSDDGRSGLSIGGRAALQRLIDDVQAGGVDFDVILVYDVSRWGRFQDTDESAYYEYICRRAGIQVAYCAEQFENDGSPNSTIIKSVKRAMAGEYSRELSVKVFAGQCRLIELGFRQGGTAGYGLRRVLVDQSGEIKGPLKFGEYKSLQTDRVILMPGPEEEVAQVNQMFRWLIDEDLSFTEIAVLLNEAEVVTDLNRPWTSGSVRTVLTGEKYIGNNVYPRLRANVGTGIIIEHPTGLGQPVTMCPAQRRLGARQHLHKQPIASEVPRWQRPDCTTGQHNLVLRSLHQWQGAKTGLRQHLHRDSLTGSKLGGRGVGHMLPADHRRSGGMGHGQGFATKQGGLIDANAGICRDLTSRGRRGICGGDGDALQRERYGFGLDMQGGQPGISVIGDCTHCNSETDTITLQSKRQSLTDGKPGRGIGILDIHQRMRRGLVRRNAGYIVECPEALNRANAGASALAWAAVIELAAIISSTASIWRADFILRT
jgi:DNA invertase Pin-like site-specific DNA recombinase